MDKNRYIAASLSNTARSAMAGAASQGVRINLYQANFSPVAKTDELKPRLLFEGFTPVENIIILQNSEGTTVELYGAKLNITRTNNIVSTQLVNRAGAVKEFIQRKDYTIDITGNLIADTTDHFPIDELQQLQELFAVDEKYKIANTFANSFDIGRVVLTKALFKQQDQKYINVLPFSLTFDSDEDYDFLIEEE